MQNNYDKIVTFQVLLKLLELLLPKKKKILLELLFKTTLKKIALLLQVVASFCNGMILISQLGPVCMLSASSLLARFVP